jgi:hypothetical protein
MCKGEEHPPGAVRADSTISSLATEESFEDGDYSSRYSPMKKEFHSLLSVEEHGKSALLFWVGSGVALGAVATVFALSLPFLLAPEDAGKTYDLPFYHYQEGISFFVNTAWTYGTDYALAVIMTVLALSILPYSQAGVSDTLCKWSAGLLLGYCVSVTAGGYSHQFYTTLEHQNSISFRILWTICVGTVSSASGFMGCSGTEVIRKFQQQPNCSPLLLKIPLIPESFWWSFAAFVTAVTAYGGMSFQRPACDIFVAGITQFPSTVYLMAFFFTVDHPKTTVGARIMGVVGFILNAPLLPMYPLLIQYTDWTLGSVNTLLHSWLCVAWCLQGYSMRHMIQALVMTNAEKNSAKAC